MVELCARHGVDALTVQLRVDRVRADLTGMDRAPDLAEAVVVGAPAERTRAMTGGEGGRLVEEEELGEAARLEQRPALPAAELELAGDPAPAVVAPADAAALVVEAAAVAVDQAARGICDELAERRDAVLQRHRRHRNAG